MLIVEDQLWILVSQSILHISPVYRTDHGSLRPYKQNNDEPAYNLPLMRFS